MKSNVEKFMMLDDNHIVRLVHTGYTPDKKWTCVKFADGHIEWVATNRLKKNIHTRSIEFIMSMGFSWAAAVNWYTFLYFISMACIIGTAASCMYMLYNMFLAL